MIDLCLHEYTRLTCTLTTSANIKAISVVGSNAKTTEIRYFGRTLLFKCGFRPWVWSELFQNSVSYPAKLILCVISLSLSHNKRQSNKSTQWSIFQDFLCMFLILHLPGFHAICVKKEKKKENNFQCFIAELLHTFRAFYDLY